MDIITPQLLYHGTVAAHIESFLGKLLDSRYWRPGRDFGEGFYTTVSAAQARDWAHRVAKQSLVATSPCVLVIELLAIPPGIEPLIFLSDSPGWASFIFEHRKVNKKGSDPCLRHPDLVIGPMADNDTGKIMWEALQLNKDADWFYDRIRRTRNGRKLDALRLGNQVVFPSEQWEEHLRLIGYHVYTGERWIYHDNKAQSTVESI